MSDTEIIESPVAEKQQEPVPAEVDESMPPATAQQLAAQEKDKKFDAYVGPEYPLRVAGDMGPAIRLTVFFVVMLATLGAVIMFVVNRMSQTAS